MYRTLLLFYFVSSGFAAFLPHRPIAGLIPQLPRNGKIIGGEETTIEDLPYQVAVLGGGALRCGGSILKENFVLTAATCSYRVASSGINTRAATSFHEVGGQFIPTRIYYNHPKYDNRRLDYDFNILKLEFSIFFGATASPIALPPQGFEIPAGTLVQVSGWGRTAENEGTSRVIRKVVIPIVDQQVCEAAYVNGVHEVTESMICAGLIDEGGKDACVGDSGGPMVLNNTVVGVVSWGLGCARPGYPGVYGRVALVRTWIDSIIES